MLPHPETGNKINALRNQERLQDVATERLAASVHSTARIRSLMGWKARLVIPAWVLVLPTPLQIVKRRLKTLPKASSPT